MRALIIEVLGLVRNYAHTTTSDHHWTIFKMAADILGEVIKIGNHPEAARVVEGRSWHEPVAA
jgi:hypothetical protein